MSTKVAKSRTFMVLVETGELLLVYSLWKRTEVDVGTSTLVSDFMTLVGPWDRDVIARLLSMTGATVRYYDRGEKQWNDFSTIGGLSRSPGSRDGQWSNPTLEEFERDYLAIV